MRRQLMIYIFLVTLIFNASCTLTITPRPPGPPSQISANGVIFTTAQSEASLDAVGGNVTGTGNPDPFPA